jgi:hypothetical protein
MKMGVILSGSPGGLENDDVSDIEFLSRGSVENVLEAPMASSHERTEQCGVALKPWSQELGYGQNDMAIGDTGQKPSADKVGPTAGVSLRTGQTEAGFTGKGDASYFSTLTAAILNKAHFVGIAAVDHLLDGFIVIGTIKFWVCLLEGLPVVAKNLLECVFVNAFHGCFLRTTILEEAG